MMAGCSAVLWPLLLVGLVEGFNVDTQSAVPMRGRPGSMFGFSIAEHRERGASWVLVGAPEAQTGQPGVSRGGAVFRCDARGADACEEVVFDRSGANNNSQGQQIDDKSNQWFGATLYSSGEDGVVVACAPRYVYFSKSVNRKDPVGTCYVSRAGFSSSAEYSPCRTKHWGYHRQGSCQAGLGAAISKDGQRLFIGAPGSWYWQGQLYYVNTGYKFPFVPPRNLPYGAGAGQAYSQSLEERPVVVATNEGPPADDDSYLGYSVATGDFDGNGETDVAVGMPRGSGLLGRVVLYSWNLTNLQNITGEQIGAYFSYSLCAVDIDGDGLDDLVVGAPFFTHFGNNEGKYETGRVYVIYQGKGERKFNTVGTLDGKNSKARFGLSLTTLGDINKDGFGDFAVGAPYDGPREKGAVYIYHGSASGVREKVSQVIIAEDLGYQFSTFGFSLSGGLDLDQNEYPDLAIGAYESDAAVFLKSRPVVKTSGSVSFSLDSKQISLEDKNCTLRDNTRVPCVDLNAFLKYSGVGVDSQLEMEVQFILDSRKPKSPRMFFLSEQGRNIMNQTVRLEKDVIHNKSMFVYMKPNLRDKLTPLEAEMRYSLRYGARTRSLSPVLDQDASTIHRDSIGIQKNCGRDNVCIPDLRLIATPSVDRYLLGSKERMEIDVLVQNEGEDAFEATFELQVPPGVNYIKIERIDKAEREIPVQCSPPNPQTNNNTLRCDIGNPLPKDRLVHFKVLFQPFHRDGMKSKYEFQMAVNSTNPENKGSISDNIKTLVTPIWVETDLILEGTSHPPDVHFNTTQHRLTDLTEGMSEVDIGPQVAHVYSIRNKGPSDIIEAEATFLWPSYTLNGEHFLYLLEQPETSGPVKCEVVEEVNPLKVELERKGKSFLESIGAATDGAYSNRKSEGGTRFQGLTEEERRRLEEERREDAAFESRHGGGFRAETHVEGSRTVVSSQGKTVSASSSSVSGAHGGKVEGRQRGRGGNRVETTYEGSSSQGGYEGGAVRGGGVRVGEAGATRSGGGFRRTESEYEQSGSRRGGASGQGSQYGEYDATRTGSGGGRRVYSSEHSHSFNSTWNSEDGGRPRTYNSSSWSVNEDGVVRSGSSSTSGYGDMSSGRSYGAEGGSRYGAGEASSRNYNSSYNYGSQSGSTLESGGRSGFESGGRYDSGGRAGSAYESSSRSGSSYEGRAGSGGSTYATSDSVASMRPHSGSVASMRPHASAGGSSSGNESHFAWSESSRSSGSAGGDSSANVADVLRQRHGDAITTVLDLGVDAGGSHNSVADGNARTGQTVSISGSRSYEADLERSGYGRHDAEMERSGGRQYGAEYERSGGSRSGYKQQSSSSYSGGYEWSSQQGGASSHKDGSRYQASTAAQTHSVDSDFRDGNGLGDPRSTNIQNRFKLYPRIRRAVEEDVYDDSTTSEVNEVDDSLKCNPVKCVKIKCTVGPLQRDQEAYVALRSRLVVGTVKKILSMDELRLSSMLSSRITRLPHIGKPEYVSVRTHEVFTQVIPTDPKPDIVPLWVVILSACAGTLILLLLIYLLYKCGFFKRNRPSNAPEKEPLNRNGHYQSGDEAL